MGVGAGVFDPALFPALFPALVPAFAAVAGLPWDAGWVRAREGTPGRRSFSPGRMREGLAS